MARTCTFDEVLAAIQSVKAGASASTTNFFPANLKEQNGHVVLLEGANDSAVLFLRKDRDFWHLYFKAVSATHLQQVISSSTRLKLEPVVADLVGKEEELSDLIAAFETSGFRRYRRLCRMAKLNRNESVQPETDQEEVQFAEISDSPAIFDLLNRSLDPFAEQLPGRREIEAATANRQILTVKREGEPTGFLFFETTGFTSTVRYWLVDERFRGQGAGGALMRRYFALHHSVRRFILWVMTDNEDAINKYRHYGFVPDALIDQVMANGMIRS